MNWWKMDRLPESARADKFCIGGILLETCGQGFARISTINRLPQISTLIVEKTVECPENCGSASSLFLTGFPHGLHPLSTGVKAKNADKKRPGMMIHFRGIFYSARSAHLFFSIQSSVSGRMRAPYCADTLMFLMRSVTMLRKSERFFMFLSTCCTA